MIKNKLMPEQVIASTPEYKEAIVRLQSADMLATVSGDQLVAVPLLYLEELLEGYHSMSFESVKMRLHSQVENSSCWKDITNLGLVTIPKLMISHEIGGLIKSKNNPNI